MAADLTGRFYEAEWPEEGEVVMAKVTSVEGACSYVTLLEYGHAQALLPHFELSNRRLRSVHHHVRPACLLVVRVYRVDREKGYIDVSKRQVDDEDRKTCEQRYVRGKLVHGMMRRLAELLSLTSEEELEDLCRKTVWRLDAEHNRQTAALNVLQEAYSDPSVLDRLDLEPTTLNSMLQVIAHRLAPRNIKIRADVKVMCWSYEGVEAVKQSLKAGKQTASSTLPVQVFVVAAPVYAVTCATTTSQYEAAMTAVRGALKAIGDTITTFKGGSFSISTEPTLVSDTPGLDAVSNFADDVSEDFALSLASTSTACA